MAEQNSRPRKFIPAFHPSLISSGVECQIWWYYFLKNIEPLPEKWAAKNLTAMTVGTAIHDEFQHILYRMGILEGVYKCVSCGHEFWATSPNGQCENCRQFFKSWEYLIFKEVPIQAGLIRGHADGILNYDGKRFLLELKSIKNVDRPNARYGYELIDKRPLDNHFIQAQLYLDGWKEMAKKASLGEEYHVDENGSLSVEKLDGPVHDGARIIGRIDFGVVEYIAKNSSDKKSFLIKRSFAPIKFLMEEMQLIHKAFLEDSIDTLTGVCYTDRNICKKCVYREVCTWDGGDAT